MIDINSAALNPLSIVLTPLAVSIRWRRFLLLPYFLKFATITPKGGEIMADNTFQTFPDGKIEALAMLYLQNQDLSGLTPEEILDKYDDAYQKIKARHREKRNAKMNAPAAAFSL